MSGKERSHPNSNERRTEGGDVVPVAKPTVCNEKGPEGQSEDYEGESGAGIACNYRDAMTEPKGIGCSDRLEESAC
jgi:hypothetical protein